MKKLKRIFLILLAVVAVIAVAAAGLFFYVSHRVQGAYFDSNGVLIHYTDEGKGVPVILVHGFAANSDLNWRKPGVTPALVKEFRVISMDLRGHGLSDKPHDTKAYGLAMGEDIIRLMDHLNIKKAHLVGYSMGGFISLKIATMHPDRFYTVSALGSGWSNPDDKVFMEALPKIGRDLREGRGVGQLAAHIGGKGERPSRLQVVMMKVVLKHLNDPAALAAVAETFPAFAIKKDDLKRLHIPVCSIIGTKDPLKYNADALVGVAPDLHRTILIGANHINAPMRRDFTATLLEFLRENSKGLAAK